VIRKLLQNMLERVPDVQQLRAQRDALLTAFSGFPPGHYYSPIPGIDEVRRNADRLFDRSLRELPGIDLRTDQQLATLEQIKVFYAEQPFHDELTPGFRYSFLNDYYSYSDALFLYGMIRLVRPRRIIEVGSGFSSFVMLDTNQRFFDRPIELTFVEPYPDRLCSRLTDDDLRTVEILRTPVQEVPLERFDALEKDDILFVDSTHVTKIGSDVNRIVFEVLPRLQSGVYVHFHDMFFPFEYPQVWLEQGRFWNEDYLVRAFLQYNSAFQIVIWNQFLYTAFRERLEQAMPLCLKNAGASLWLQRR